MSVIECPSDVQLVCFVDADLSPERLQLIDAHLQECGVCARAVDKLRQAVLDLAAPLEVFSDAQLAAHVGAVMSQLDASAKEPLVARTDRA
ncbi:MAG: hypothetical protein RJA70_4545 [Pseudomonadota bacterium]|jgi:anti-sigma factor RsiW